MSFKSELLKVNEKLAQKAIKLRIEKRGHRLSIRGPLPCEDNPNETKDQRISLGLKPNAINLVQAEKTLNFLYLQIEHNQFNWRNWSQSKSNLPPKKDQSNIEDVIDEFKSDFFNDPKKSSSNSSSRSNWGSSYLPYLQRLKVIAAKQNRKLNKALFIETLKSYSENSRSRQQCGSSLKAFGDYCKIELPSNWRSLAYGYGLHKAQFRQLPSDKQIEKIYEMIPNPKWKLVYGLMATYGLRNHEVFFCDLSCLKKGGDKILRVFPNTKTGEHQVWPFHPEWIEKFQLNDISHKEDFLPAIKTDLTKTTLQNVGRRVSEQFRRYQLPLTPYNLRHAWAIRTIHIGLPDTVSARMMGHSVSIHTQTYHHWITRRDQQQAVDKALSA